MSKRNKLNFGQRVGLFVLLRGCQLVGLLPRWFLYGVLLNAIYFLFYKLAGYRVGVVRDNLSRSFPEKSTEELRRIERRFYKHLSEIMVDMIDLSSIGRKAYKRRFKIEGLDELRLLTAGTDWIAVGAHYGSWEYNTGYPAYMEEGRTMYGVYRPLHNVVFDEFYKRIRSRFGMRPVPMNDLLRTMSTCRQRSERFVLGVVGDQTPPMAESPNWFRFLNQKTAFFMGFEKIALKYNIQVYYYHVSKISKGHYVIQLEQIYDGQQNVQPGEVTGRYVRKLERSIIDRPELWLWSHRRWKHDPQLQGKEYDF